MKQFYLEKIKKIKEKIAFLQNMILDEQKELDKYTRWVGECEIEEKVDKYRKQLEESKNGK